MRVLVVCAALLLVAQPLRVAWLANGTAISPNGLDLDAFERITYDNVSQIQEILSIPPESEQRNYSGDVAFSPTSELFAFAMGDSLHMWDIARGEYLWRVPCCNETVEFSPDNQRLVSSGDYHVRIWNAYDSTDYIQIDTRPRSDLPGLTFSDIRYPLGGQEIVGAFANTNAGIVRWTNEGELIEEIDFGYGPDIPTANFLVMDGGAELVAYVLNDSPSSSLEIREVATNTVRSRINFDNILPSPDDSYSITPLTIFISQEVIVDLNLTPEDGIVVWINFAGAIRNYQEHSLGRLTTAELTSDLLLLGSSNGDIHIWESIGGLPLTILQGHTDAIIDLGFSPGNEVLASSSLDGTVRFWGIPS